MMNSTNAATPARRTLDDLRGRLPDRPPDIAPPRAPSGDTALVLLIKRDYRVPEQGAVENEGVHFARPFSRSDFASRYRSARPSAARFRAAWASPFFVFTNRIGLSSCGWPVTYWASAAASSLRRAEASGEIRVSSGWAISTRIVVFSCSR